MIVNAILSRKGKITFQVLLIVLYQWSAINGQFNLYDTYQRFESNALQFDCLNYRIRRETLAYQLLSDVVEELIPFCFRPGTSFRESLNDFDNSFSQQLSFEELRMAGITAQQLLSWSISMEEVERYQFYLNEPKFVLNEYIYNCTPPRFGLRCQYSFEFGNQLSFNEIVEGNFQGRVAYSESSDLAVVVPCYVLLKCHRNGQPWCLDWREVCDGVVDCVDNGVDEQSCFEMEVNECSDDEYRCHNGLCISQEFWEDGLDDTECLDRTDSVADFSYVDFCFQDPTFRCEEHSCRPSFNSFSCGDGQCVFQSENCCNGRHALLTDSMTAKGNLTDICRNAMACLTRLMTKVNGTPCDTWLMHTDTVKTALEQCGSFFQFPTVPVHSDHIRFFYKDPSLRANMTKFLMPDYVCYDQQLCDFLIPDFVQENQTCLNTTKLIQNLIIIGRPWHKLISFIKQYSRFCLISHIHTLVKINYNDYPSLYNCRNSSKFISKHRLLDNIIDCFQEDDEKYPSSCQLNDRYRVTCVDTTRCWSPIVKNRACVLNGLDHVTEISFQSFCDGIKAHYYYDDDKRYDDEFECENWSCDNTYARCDGFWACSDGRDEHNCMRTKCSVQTYACISPVNYSVICLPSDFVNDGKEDCLGGLDEQTKYSRVSTSHSPFLLFYCSVKPWYTQVSKLCDKKVECPEGEDESVDLCKNQQLTCDWNSSHSRSETEEILCELHEVEKRKIKYFSIYTSFNYPSLENQLLREFNHWAADHHLIKSIHPSQIRNNTWPWYCHRGLVLSTSLMNSTGYNRSCICPPGYYGDLCQYQNQRISLTLRLTSNDRHATYAVVSMLMDDSDERREIGSYDQSIYSVKRAVV